jgi:hypothetical protein
LLIQIVIPSGGLAREESAVCQLLQKLQIPLLPSPLPRLGRHSG